MRAYSASSEEARRARDLLQDWRGEGLLTPEQYQRMEQETVCEFRRTNIFLRIVLFVFTVILVGAAVGLFFVVFHSQGQTSGIFLLIFAAVSYGAAEVAVSDAQLYRYGIEEALAVCSVAFLCLGIQLAFGRTGFVIPAAGAILSLWLWYRFGLRYAFPGAMLFIAWMSTFWTSSPSGQHVIVAALYLAGLLTVAAVRPRHHATYLDTEYSVAEALLWLGIYLAINLQIWSLRFPGPFYWTTWVLIWCLPPVVLTRGARRKDRFVIAVGAIAAVLTLVTNKPYLGWQRHTWDPMLLGALLIGAALLIRHWLAQSPTGIRGGFTARRQSAKDARWMTAAVGTIGLASPDIVTPKAQSNDPNFHFGGGDSGGGGATSDF